MGLPAIGTEAPAFTLASTSGELVSLAGFRGTHHVLLAFFPLAFTSTCTAEMCAFSEDFAAFAAADTVVLPISVDSVPTLRAYKEREGMRHDLLSDFKREVSRLYGTLDEERFLSRRAYIVIDKVGMVRWSFVETVSGARRDNAELLGHLAALT